LITLSHHRRASMTGHRSQRPESRNFGFPALKTAG
jgi:hypothetical protein